MKIMILGSAGMLGKAIYFEGKRRDFEIIGVDIANGQILLDITDSYKLASLIEHEKPDVIINTVAITSIEICENDPGQAYLVNARPVAVLAPFCKKLGIYFIHISTDHFFTGDKTFKHSESDPVKLLNEYARTKYTAEQFGLTNSECLIIRTNILGFKINSEKQVFADWIFKSLEANAPMRLFDDFFTSSLTVTQLSKYIFDLLPLRPHGILNVASQDVFSKKELILAINKKAGFCRTNMETVSVLDLYPKRAESLGLNVNKIEKLLGISMPSFEEVVGDLLKEYGRISSEI